MYIQTEKDMHERFSGMTNNSGSISNFMFDSSVFVDVALGQAVMSSLSSTVNDVYLTNQGPVEDVRMSRKKYFIT